MSCHKINPKADCIICETAQSGAEQFEQSVARPIRLSKAKITQKTITHISWSITQSKQRFPTTILQLLIASVASLLGLCAGDVSHINHELPKDIVVPFNDLLPPPLAVESTTEAPKAVVTTRAATTKPTKKSYYQQQAKSKDTQIAAAAAAAEMSSASKLPVPELALDLLPPLAEPATGDAAAVKDDRTPAAAHITSPAQTTTTERSVPRVVRVKPQVAQARVSRPNSIASEASASSTNAAKTNTLTADLIAQYATYFQFTTPRPRRGPLPTLTPFPSHRKL